MAAPPIAMAATRAAWVDAGEPSDTPGHIQAMRVSSAVATKAGLWPAHSATRMTTGQARRWSKEPPNQGVQAARAITATRTTMKASRYFVAAALPAAARSHAQRDVMYLFKRRTASALRRQSARIRNTRLKPEATLGNVSSRGVCGRDNLSGVVRRAGDGLPGVTSD